MKPRAKPSQRPPQVGDFIVRDAWDGKCGAVVCRKTGERWDDYERVSHCETDHAARALAALLNDASELARNWRQLNTIAPPKGDAKAWALHKIVRAVADAIGSPPPEFPSTRTQEEIA